MKRNAKILPEEVLKLVLAAVVILILITLLYNLYAIFFQRSELEKARATLDKIVGKAKRLEEGEETDVLVTGPEGWGILYYNRKLADHFKKEPCLPRDKGNGRGVWMPKDCEGKNCLCICDLRYPGEKATDLSERIAAGVAYSPTGMLGKCDEKAVCKKIKLNVGVDNYFFNNIKNYKYIDKECMGFEEDFSYGIAINRIKSIEIEKNKKGIMFKPPKNAKD